MLHPSARIRTLTTLAWIKLLIIGCNAVTPVPSSTPTLADNPTSGAIVRATRIVQATQDAKSTAEAQATLDESATRAADRATQTEQAHLDAAATAAAWATREAILAAQAAWPNRLRDSFEDNHLNWPIGVTKDNSLSVDSQIVVNRYQWRVQVFNGNSYFNLIPTESPVLSDFHTAVTVQFTRGSEDGMAAYGLTFRHVEDDYGFFGITRTGLFRILEVHGTGVYQLEMSDSAAIDSHPGALNRLAAIGVGPDFVFLINDQVVGQMNADIAPGQMGLGVDTLGSSPQAIVEFSDFQINAPN
ncbi:MAG TPA: hypothetical protein VFR47_22320 [Anaerolineales bacterium]|nr:hypothetical protein [Anaerolineales bacterium]